MLTIKTANRVHYTSGVLKDLRLEEAYRVTICMCINDTTLYNIVCFGVEVNDAYNWLTKLWVDLWVWTLHPTITYTVSLYTRPHEKCKMVYYKSTCSLQSISDAVRENTYSHTHRSIRLHLLGVIVTLSTLIPPTTPDPPTPCTLI